MAAGMHTKGHEQLVSRAKRGRPAATPDGRDDVMPLSLGRSRFEMGPRVLVYSHDTFGLGHFRRCLKIGRELNRLSPSASILLVTGSPMAHRFSLADGIDFVKLPAVVKAGDDQYRARSLKLDIDELISVRTAIISEVCFAFRPDVILVDHAPLGLRGELLPALESLQNHPCRPHLLLGLRDIIDDAAKIVSQWSQAGMYEMIERYYDAVMIYGQADVFDTIGAYRFPPGVCAKTSYVGYVAGERSDTTHIATTHKSHRPLVLVTVGGGEDGGLIVDACLAMMRQNTTPEFDVVLLPGPLLGDEQVRELRQSASGLPIEILHFVEDVAPLLGHADLVVSMGGYNAATEILAHAQRAIVIPREYPRVEQLLRAQRFEELGWLRLLRISELSPKSLYRLISEMLRIGESPLVAMREVGHLALDGATTIASGILEHAAIHRPTESSA